jgi:hypothetical protein
MKKKNLKARTTVAMKMAQLPTLASGAQSLGVMTKRDTQFLQLSIGLASMRLASTGAIALEVPSVTCS